jgi:hypothetical protein
MRGMQGSLSYDISRARDELAEYLRGDTAALRYESYRLLAISNYTKPVAKALKDGDRRVYHPSYEL